MKFIYICLSFCLFQVSSIAQTTITSLTESIHSHSTSDKCFSDQLLDDQRQNTPDFLRKLDQMNSAILQSQSQGRNREHYIIPVVVHVVHDDGDENISDEQIFAGIQHLNDAFANTGGYAHADGVTTNIEFCLASRTPTGQYTNGITRTQSILTNMTVEIHDLLVKDVVRWDPNKYLNIWLVNEITSLSMGDGIAGYAYFPTSQGLPNDGIVNEARWFGSSFDNSKVHIHEVGHYLGLYHTFEGGCSNQDCQLEGDRVCDTPPDNSTAAVPCSAQPNTCATDTDDTSENNPFRSIDLGGLGDQPDQFKNYMDYGYQACQAYFSEGQANRMQAAVSTQRAILLESDACESPCMSPIDLDVLADNTTITLGDSISLEALSSGATSFEWTIDGQVVGEESILDYLFPSAGNFVVYLAASNDDPNCPKTTSVLIQVDCPAKALFAIATNPPFSPGTQIETINHSINNITNQWILDGIQVSNDAEWTETFTDVGGHSIYLIVSNDECADTSNTQFFQVGTCDLSGVTDDWVFLNNRIRFVDGQAIWFPGSPIQDGSVECSSSIADVDGNLLFFSDGMSVWDRAFNLMPNGTGLLGHRSATQSVLITPHPGNANQYFVFTNDAVENMAQPNGMCYNIVDMTLNNGFGDVLPAFKNKPLLAHGTEKLSATWHANGRDIWVGSSEYQDNSWYSFLIDNDGIHTTPVVSHIGTANNSMLGAMRFSNDGNRMAACVISPWPWRILVCDFNRQTGVYSNPMELLLSAEFNQQPFSIAFSPDNSKLYVSTWQGGDILQYDLSLTTVTQIQNSVYAVDPYTYGSFGHLVLASNGKIYVKGRFDKRLDEIRNPNGSGALCDYWSNPTSIPASQGSSSCLPNMMQGYFMAHKPHIVGPQNICVGSELYQYGISFESQLDSAVWEHSGPGTLMSQSGSNICTLISGEYPGTDTVTVTVYGRCGVSTDTISIQTNLPELTQLEDITYFCDSTLLNPGNNFLSYEWSDGTYESTKMVYSEGFYKVTVRGQSGCDINDSTHVMMIPPYPGQADLGPDITLCEGQIAVLHTAEEYEHYLWQDGSQNPTLTVFQPGIYWVKVTHGCDESTSTDTLQVSLSNFEIDLNYLGDKLICNSELPFILNAPPGYEGYFWNDGQNTSSIQVDSIGEYAVTVINSDGCSSSDTLWVEVCTDMEPVHFTDSVGIFPNPADEYFAISADNQIEGKLKMYSLSGQLIYQAQIAIGKETKVPVYDIANGLYVVQLNFGTTVSYLKIAISH